MHVCVCVCMRMCMGMSVCAWVHAYMWCVYCCIYYNYLHYYGWSYFPEQKKLTKMSTLLRNMTLVTWDKNNNYLPILPYRLPSLPWWNVRSILQRDSVSLWGQQPHHVHQIGFQSTAPILWLSHSLLPFCPQCSRNFEGSNINVPLRAAFSTATYSLHFVPLWRDFPLLCLLQKMNFLWPRLRATLISDYKHKYLEGSLKCHHLTWDAFPCDAIYSASPPTCSTTLPSKVFPIKMSLIERPSNKGGETGHEKVDIAWKVRILSFIL